MGRAVKFGSKRAADAARSEFEDHLARSDDRRLKTVRFDDDAPDWVIESAEIDAEDSLEGETAPKAIELSEGGRDQIREHGGFTKHATVSSWGKAKAVFQEEGLADQWRDAVPALVDYEDPVEGAREWIDRHKGAQESGIGPRGGATDVGLEEEQVETARTRAARAAKAGECDHAAGHCEHGDPEACEFLRNRCGYTDEEIEQLIGGDERPESAQEITGAALGAIARSWQGYKGGISEMDKHLEHALEAKRHAEQAGRAINAIREDHGQDPLKFRRLEEISDVLERAGEIAHSEHPHVEATAAEDVDGDSVLETEPGAQSDLSGDVETEQQAALANAPDEPTRETDVERAENPGGIMADERSEEEIGRGRREQRSTEQRTFRDPNQKSLSQ